MACIYNESAYKIMSMNKKEAGILMHISSLPSPYGIGTFGKAAYEFVDFLRKSKIKVWQILPLNVTSYGDSPYQSPSNYGFNYYFIDLDLLVDRGLITKDDVKDIDFGSDENRVDYKKIFDNRLAVLKKAFNNFTYTKEFKDFLKTNVNAHDFSFFMTLKELNNYDPWFKWNENIRTYSKELEEKTIKENQHEFEFYMWTQFEFLNEYRDLKAYANKNGIRMMGDIPIYLAYDSVECYKYPEMFQFNENHEPISVAGCPPDCFSVDGQLWGNPLYNWEYHKNTGYKWWNERISSALRLYDLVRIDHFRGFSGYYSIPYKDETAKNGKWVKGPGIDLFKDKVDYPIVAEDLGMLDEDFYTFMKQTGYPGMKIVIQGLEDLDTNNTWRPRNYDNHYYSYTSTHDSETALQYLNRLELSQKELVKKVLNEECEYFNIELSEDPSDIEITNKIVELNIASDSLVAITPMQDLLALGEEARMNYPSTLSTKNWSWRITKKEFEARKDEISSRLLKIITRYKRS